MLLSPWFRRTASMPGPRWPGWYQRTSYLRSPFRFLRRCRRRFGDTFGVRFSRLGPIALFSRPEHLARILQADPDELSTAPNPAIFALAPQGSLFHLAGRRHAAAKAVCQKALRTLATPECRHVMQTETEKACAEVDVRGPVDLRALAEDIGRRSAWRLLFGDRPTTAAWLEAGRAFSEGIPFLTAMTGRYSRLARELRETTRQSLCGEAPAGPLLREFRNALESDVLRPDEMLPVAVSVGMAALGGLGSALGHLMFHLADHPRTQAPLAGCPDADAPYVEAFVSESLRISPDVPTLVRRAERPTTIGDTPVPAGTLVGACVYLAHVSPDCHPQPDEFRPERFLDGRKRPATWLPFGKGRRKCPSAAFVPAVLRTIVWTFAKRFVVQPVKPLKDAVSLSFVLTRRSRPIPVQLALR